MSDFFLQDLISSVKMVQMSKSSLETLMEFERVLDDLDLFSFLNWSDGELREGPVIKKYRVSATFAWPLHSMPDPSGAERLLQYDIKVSYRKAWMKFPIRVKNESDFRPDQKKPKIGRARVWLVEINIPKHLIKDISKGSAEIMDQEIDLEDLDDAYAKDLDADSESGENPNENQ